MWFVILLATAAFLIYLRIAKTMRYWKDRNIPYVKPLPILGNSAALLFRKRSFNEQAHHLYRVYPDKRYYGTFSFMTPQILIRDPDLIKQVTIKDFDYFMNRTVIMPEDVEPIFTKNLAGLKGQHWRDMRSTLSPAFTSSKMKFLFTLISDCAEQFITYFEKEHSEEVIDAEMKDIFSRFTNDAIATAAFGITVDSLHDKNNEFFRTGKDLTSFGGLRALRFFGYIVFPSIMRFFRVPLFSKTATIFVRDIIKETISVREEKGVVRPDMIHILLEARKGQIKEEEEEVHHADEGFSTVNEDHSNKDIHHKALLTDDDIAAQALIFFFAGFETTSTVMTFMAYELAVNQDIQLTLQKEIDEALARCHGKINYETLLAMKYLDMVISETLRRWSPGSSLDRMCVKDYEITPKLPGEVPVTIPKGTSVVIPAIGLHLDPQYFPNPNQFDPERFSEENKGNIAPFTYMPFGTGPRNCIASRFALMETKILFFHLLSQFEIVPTAKTPIPLVPSKTNFTMIPDNGIWLGFKQRAKH